MVMRTRREQMTAGGLDGYGNFIGDDSEYRDWFGVVGRSRDSGCLEESNFHAALRMLGGEGDDVRVERYGHWGVGWIEEVYVRPGTGAARVAGEIEAVLENYPVLDDEDFSRRESEAADEAWRECYNDTQRLAYIREHSSEFEFHDYLDLIGCVRGRWFRGYASEMAC